MNSIEKIIKGREIAICGIGKFQEDFEYVFDTLKPQFYISDNSDKDTYKGLPVYKTFELKKYNLQDILIVVCDLEANKKGIKNREWNKLEIAGYQQGIDFIFADELFPTLDFDWRENAAGRKIAIWGTGAECKKYYLSNHVRADIFIDKYKAGKTFNGIEIVHPDQLDNKWKEYYVIVMTHAYYHEVFEYLSSKGLGEVEDFVSYHLIYDHTYAKPSEMMEKTVYTIPIEGQPFCSAPFEMMQLRFDGHIIGCDCPPYVDEWMAPFGNYTYEPYEKIWMSASAKIFRLSILNNTYCFCRETLCRIMKPERVENVNVARRKAVQPKEIPSYIYSEMDDACNLACLSCRRTPKYLEEGQKYHSRLMSAQKLKRTGWLQKTDSFGLAGNGEVFYSKVYRNLLYHDEPEKRNHITITSNGVLFNEREFLHLQQNYKSISAIISVDGMKKETYEQLRPGSNFERLMRNLEMLSKHKKAGELRYWQINFVVQRANYLQMRDMILQAEKWGVDKLYFIQIMNILQLSQLDFDKISMANQNGTLKPELIKCLEDPIFNSSIVYMPWFDNRT